MIRPFSLRRGNTLLEVTLATTLITTALVPALKYMRDAVTQSSANNTRAVLLSLAVGLIEQQLCVGSAAWTETSTSGSFSSDGYSSYRYTAVRSQQVADGGVVNKLMAVTVTVYEDVNGNSTMDSGETRVVLASKVAKLSKYQNEAS